MLYFVLYGGLCQILEYHFKGDIFKHKVEVIIMAMNLKTNHMGNDGNKFTMF